MLKPGKALCYRYINCRIILVFLALADWHTALWYSDIVGKVPRYRVFGFIEMQITRGQMTEGQNPRLNLFLKRKGMYSIWSETRYITKRSRTFHIQDRETQHYSSVNILTFDVSGPTRHAEKQWLDSVENGRSRGSGQKSWQEEKSFYTASTIAYQVWVSGVIKWRRIFARSTGDDIIISRCDA